MRNDFLTHLVAKIAGTILSGGFIRDAGGHSNFSLPFRDSAGPMMIIRPPDH